MPVAAILGDTASLRLSPHDKWPYLSDDNLVSDMAATEVAGPSAVAMDNGSETSPIERTLLST